jgi:3-mercaptopyruvate sulfurtransferase SseA
MSKMKSYICALAAVMATVVFVWYGQQPGAPVQATWNDVLAEAKVGGYRIITTEEVASRYRNESTKLLLVDTRQEWEYRTGHIDGAVNFPMDPTWWSRLSNAGKLEEFLGPDKNRFLVFY